VDNARQLALIKEFFFLCRAASIPCWLRGGWAMDFFLGRVTREHEDIDFFAWAADVPKLMPALERAGFVERCGPPPETQRDFTKDSEDVQIALLAKNAHGQVVVAGGPAEWAPWPDDMLGYPAGRLADVICPIIHPRVQIWIKEQSPDWHGVPLSVKHQVDVALLRDALTARGNQALAEHSIAQDYS
jgi:hypothetical protein